MVFTLGRIFFFSLDKGMKKLYTLTVSYNGYSSKAYNTVDK
ncbi:MAG: hypothetical protein EZS26_003216 [Candidatus Ordinivivax streblomastigis]|uniref:Uncharacterized protein n=1 Tax=Candidatus Ordinivivax streblomastigis TaxID=2540710 RepID=A0A5M8NUU2_9BACT|nr:MAG: hypothetical protein EZS26_003216 [Candidatus Ordinivivax streblomastigis]